jgi:hypothetical protein
MDIHIDAIKVFWTVLSLVGAAAGGLFVWWMHRIEKDIDGKQDKNVCKERHHEKPEND